MIPLNEIEEREEVVVQALDVAPREVMIRAACVKSNGKKITIKDFPVKSDHEGIGVGVAETGYVTSVAPPVA